jgi:hypothetical protein
MPQLEEQEPVKPWWEAIVGKLADNSAYDEAMQIGREYRESQRPNHDSDDSVTWAERIGYDAVYAIGGTLVRTTP